MLRVGPIVFSNTFRFCGYALSPYSTRSHRSNTHMAMQHLVLLRLGERTAQDDITLQ